MGGDVVPLASLYDEAPAWLAPHEVRARLVATFGADERGPRCIDATARNLSIAAILAKPLHYSCAIETSLFFERYDSWEAALDKTSGVYVARRCVATQSAAQAVDALRHALYAEASQMVLHMERQCGVCASPRLRVVLARVEVAAAPRTAPLIHIHAYGALPIK